jgi:iron complex transport system ATP-binding protein
MRLTVAGVSVEIERHRIVSEVDLVVEPGQVVGLIGPNGSGKTTLLRAVYRALRPVSGVISLDADDLWSISARQAARRRALVTQYDGAPVEFSVEEVVAMGRTPHKGMLDRDGADDRSIVHAALERVGMDWAVNRLFSTLSGGERQRTLVARALAQQAPLLVLDEPTNHLDVRAQLELLELVRDLGLTTLAALHDLDQAASYCDRLAVLSQGTLVANGAPLDVLTPTFLADVFGVRAHIGENPLTGRPHISVAPLGKRP